MKLLELKMETLAQEHRLLPFDATASASLDGTRIVARPRWRRMSVADGRLLALLLAPTPRTRADTPSHTFRPLVRTGPRPSEATPLTGAHDPGLSTRSEADLSGELPASLSSPVKGRPVAPDVVRPVGGCSRHRPRPCKASPPPRVES
jgi:hypothetical protein